MAIELPIGYRADVIKNARTMYDRCILKGLYYEEILRCIPRIWVRGATGRGDPVMTMDVRSEFLILCVQGATDSDGKLLYKPEEQTAEYERAMEHVRKMPTRPNSKEWNR